MSSNFISLENFLEFAGDEELNDAALKAVNGGLGVTVPSEKLSIEEIEKLSIEERSAYFEEDRTALRSHLNNIRVCAKSPTLQW